jgi:hydrogenase/urease accessory protein HupE
VYAHLQPMDGGWWVGVLHPVEAFDDVMTIVLVGLLGGLAVRAGRSSWTLPTVFVVVSVVAGWSAARLDSSFDVRPALVVVSVVLALCCVVESRHTAVVGSAAVLVAAVVAGVGHGADRSGHTRPVTFAAGLLFTSGLILTVGAIIGSSIGRWALARRAAVPCAARPSAIPSSAAPSSAVPSSAVPADDHAMA